MQCLLFRRGAQMNCALTKLSLPAHGDPPPWLDVDGVHYSLMGREPGGTRPHVYQERCPPPPFLQTLQEVKNAAAGWFDKIPTPTATSEAFKGLEYHVNDGVGEDSPASTSSVKYFRAKIADLESRLDERNTEVSRLSEIVDGLNSSRARWIVDYNESVAREGRLREEIQRIQLRLADACKEVVALEVHEEEVARLKGIADSTFKKLHSVEEEYERLRGVRNNLEAEIRLLREGFDPQLVAKELEIQRLNCAIRIRDAAKADEDRAVKYAESLMDKIQKISEIIRR